MRVGISLTSNHPDVKDPRQGARWMIERAAAAGRAGLDSPGQRADDTNRDRGRAWQREHAT